jgi:hypothetical protein
MPYRFDSAKAKEIRKLADTPEIRARRAAAVHATAEAKKARLPITQQLINELHNSVDGTKDGMTKMRALVKTLVEKAILGEALAIKEVFDRVEGKARQQVDVTHGGDISVRSAALSFLDQVVADVLRREQVRPHAHLVPERPVLSAPLHLSEERSGASVDICEVPGGSAEP